MSVADSIANRTAASEEAAGTMQVASGGDRRNRLVTTIMPSAEGVLQVL
jgi:hypothetical protein